MVGDVAVLGQGKRVGRGGREDGRRYMGTKEREATGTVE